MNICLKHQIPELPIICWHASSVLFLLHRWTQINTRASAMAFQWLWGKMVSEAWQRAGLPLSSVTPCRDCASSASTKCSRSSTVTCWERWGKTQLSTQLCFDKVEHVCSCLLVLVSLLGDEELCSGKQVELKCLHRGLKALFCSDREYHPDLKLTRHIILGMNC